MRYRDLRWPCDHPVVMQRGQQDMRARIVNISTSGARVESERALERGERVAIGLAGPPVMAEVRWVRGGLAGLRFDRVLTPREIGTARKAETGGRRGGGWNLHLRELR
jgi:hypothetical protein